MAQRLRVLLAVLPEVLSSIPNNHNSGSQPSTVEPDALFWHKGVHADKALI